IGLAGTGWLARYVPREVVPDEAEVTVGAGGGPGPEPSGDASTRG
ncbi:MFS transporter, partial [Propionibacterium freudenreichii]|nr:MFS transporter [Propionibacterium freudenreichii]